MEPHPLTEWNAQERAGLVALETDEWRKKRLLAEDTNTPAAVLDTLASEVETHAEEHAYDKLYNAAFLLTEAILTNANTPPPVLQRCFHLNLPLRAPALCRNPIASFLEWETPGFWQGLDGGICEDLLGVAALPASVAFALTQHEDEDVREAARFHVSQAAPLQTPDDGCKALTKYWQNYCAVAEHDVVKDWHTELVEFGLMPACLTRFIMVSPPQPPQILERVRDFHDHEKEVRDGFRPKPQANPLPNTAEFGYLLTYLNRYHATPDELMQAAQIACEHNQEHWFDVIVSHRSVSTDVLRFLARHQKQGILSTTLTAHPLTPPDVLVELVDASFNSNHSTLRRLACRHINAPPNMKSHAHDAFIKATDLRWYRTPLLSFLSALRPNSDRSAERAGSQSTDWKRRLCVALTVPARLLIDEPFSDDEWKRTPRQLLEHLAHDGNCFVQWAAKMRLADPNFAFTWLEGDE